MRHPIVDHDRCMNKITGRQALRFIPLEQLEGAVHVVPRNGQDVDFQRFDVPAYRKPGIAFADHDIAIEYFLQHFRIDQRRAVMPRAPSLAIARIMCVQGAFNGWSLPRAYMNTLVSMKTRFFIPRALSGWTAQTPPNPRPHPLPT